MHREHEQPFASHKSRPRPVILATPVGPDTRLFPRSTQPPKSQRDRGIRHGAHSHAPDPPCRIDRPGWVLLGKEVTVDARLLGQDAYSCEEPEETGLLDEIRKAVAI